MPRFSPAGTESSCRSRIERKGLASKALASNTTRPRADSSHTTCHAEADPAEPPVAFQAMVTPNESAPSARNTRSADSPDAIRRGTVNATASPPALKATCAPPFSKVADGPLISKVPETFLPPRLKTEKVVLAPSPAAATLVTSRGCTESGAVPSLGGGAQQCQRSSIPNLHGQVGLVACDVRLDLKSFRLRIYGLVFDFRGLLDSWSLRLVLGMDRLIEQIVVVAQRRGE